MRKPRPEGGSLMHAYNLRDLMSEHRLTVGEVAEAAGVSRRSITRLRNERGPETIRPRPQTVRRVADALSDLTHLDADEIYRDLMTDYGLEGEIRQGDLGTRGAAELVSRYRAMNPIGRHILLEHARLLARELPGES